MVRPNCTSTDLEKVLLALLQTARFRGSVVTSSEDVLAEPEKGDPGDHAGDRCHGSDHQRSQHESEEEETSALPERPFALQKRKHTSIEHGKYCVRSSANPKAPQHRLTVRPDMG